MALTKVTYSMIDGAVVNVKDWGATGDGTTDDTAAIQAALDYLATLGDGGGVTPFRRSGGTLFFPNGTYKTTAPLIPLPGRYKLCGTGRFKQYSQVFDPQPDCLPTIMPVHTGRAAILVDAGSSEVSFVIEDMNIATVETGDMPTAAIAWKSSAEFQTDYTFNRIAITGFTSAFDIYNSGGQGVGLVTVNDCSITRNTHVWRNLDGQIVNVLRFIGNQAGQNTNGMTLEGSDIIINGNNFESNNNAINVNGTYTGLRISNNYFESNGGDYVISLGSTNNAIIENNTAGSIIATQYIQLTSDSNTVVNETSLIPQPIGSFNLQTKNNAIKPLYSATAGVGKNTCSVALYYSPDLVKSTLAEGVSALYETAVTATGYHKNIPNSAGYSYTTSGGGIAIDTNVTGLATSVNSWIIVTLLVTYDNELDNGLAPTLYFLPDGSSDPADGYDNVLWYEFNNSAPLVQNQTVTYTFVKKVPISMSSLKIQFYPYGLNPTAGKTCVVSNPFVYTSGSSLDGMFGGNMQPFVAPSQIYQSSAAPIAGTWPTGWTLINSAPTSSGYIGWVCTSGGTPGTWKDFGLIS